MLRSGSAHLRIPSRPPGRNDEPRRAIGPSDDGECPGRRTAPARRVATKPCAPSGTSAGRSGASGEGPAPCRFRGGPERGHLRSRAETRMPRDLAPGAEARRRSASISDRRPPGSSERRRGRRPPRCLTFDRQTAELQSPLAILNRPTAPGIPATQPSKGKANAGRQATRATRLIGHRRS
jgi:hypothetical protein